MHPSYKKIKQVPIEEINVVYHEYEHIGSGAQVVYIESDDDENVFSLSFRTYPKDSGGVAHILEHTVLCGSKKYPVKDPFFSMSGRSLNTFMNAMTGSDFTCYPAASLVKKDFYNLLEVYIDCVFFPLLKKFSFMQEGHHFDFASAKDYHSALHYGGIVFNEMKGSLSSPETRLWHFLFEHLFTDLTYRFNSGGDPKEIPNLTYEDFLAFHKEFYDPSRCLFYFYGNFPIEEHLRFIDEKVLSKAKKLPPLSPLPLQRRFHAPIKVDGSYPTEEQTSEQKTYLVYSWLTTHITHQEDLLALTLIDSLLMDTDGSPLKLKILESKLCASAFSEMDTEISEIPYVIIIKGSEAEHLRSIQEIIFNTLKEVYEKGFSEKEIEASIHQLELSRLEIGSDSYPYGLSLFWRCALMKQHGALGEDGLKILSLFASLREKLKDHRYLPKIMKKYLIDNPHFISLTFSPDPSLLHKESEEEKHRLEKVSERLSDEARKALFEEWKEFKKFQKDKEDKNIECLPKVVRGDIPLSSKDYPLNHTKVGDLDLYYHDCFTNDFIYLDIHYPLPALSDRELHYAQLLVSLLPELGAGSKSYLEQLSLIHRYTGGISAGIYFHGISHNPSEIQAEFVIKGKALKRNQKKLFEILHDLIGNVRLDEKERIKELLLQTSTHLQSYLNKRAMGYATKYTLSGFSPLSSVKNHLTGLPFYHFIQNLMKDIDQNLDDVINHLVKVKEILIHGHHPIAVYSGRFEDLDQKALSHIGNIEKRPFVGWKQRAAPSSSPNKAFIISSSVAFTALAIPSVGFEHPLSAALNILPDLLSNAYLHQAVREQGGAYGVGAQYHPITETFHLYSYRDPHIAPTLEAFHASLEKIEKGDFTQDDIDEALFEVIQDIDSPVSPGSTASVGYSWKVMHRTQERRQNYRTSLLHVSKKDLQDAAHYIRKQITNGCAATFAPRKLVEEKGSSFTERETIS